MTRKIQVGTVIEGTLKSEDLLEAFTGEIEYLWLTNTITGQYLDQSIAQTYYDAKEILSKYETETGVDEIEASEIVNELIDKLNENAPPYMYFGTLEGDGANFGWWIDRDSLEEDMKGAIPTDNPEVKWIPDCYDQSNQVCTTNRLVSFRTECESTHGYYLEVNDHGNMTLRNAKREEIWSVV